MKECIFITARTSARTKIIRYEVKEFVKTRKYSERERRKDEDTEMNKRKLLKRSLRSITKFFLLPTRTHRGLYISS